MLYQRWQNGSKTSLSIITINMEESSQAKDTLIAAIHAVKAVTLAVMDTGYGQM